MITVQTIQDRVEAKVFGEFTLADFKKFEEAMIYAMKFQGRIDVLLDLREMQSFTLDVAWEDVRFAREHPHDFGAVAVLTESSRDTWAAFVSQFFIDGNIQVFTDQVLAREWLAQGKADTQRSYTTLISAPELADNLGRVDWLLLDCRYSLTDKDYGAQQYAKGHIPGAHWARLDQNLASMPNGQNGRHPLPQQTAFAEWLASLGMAETTQVVAYDDAGGMFAARAWWLLRYFGHEFVAVLDGGYSAWLACGGEITREVPDKQASIEKLQLNPLSDMSVDVAHISRHLYDKSMQIIDARAPDRFNGENETIDPVGGHIPGALNRFFKLNLQDNGCFKTPPELRAEFSALLKGKSANEVVHQCGSGVTACHNLLAMEYAGLTGSRLYPGSWSEWCSDPVRPMERV